MLLIALTFVAPDADACTRLFLPHPTHTQPADGAAGVPMDAVVRVMLGDNNQSRSDELELTVTEDGAPVAGAIEVWQAAEEGYSDYSFVVFTPDALFSPGAEVEVRYLDLALADAAAAQGSESADVVEAQLDPYVTTRFVVGDGLAVRATTPELRIDWIELGFDHIGFSSCRDIRDRDMQFAIEAGPEVALVTLWRTDEDGEPLLRMPALAYSVDDESLDFDALLFSWPADVFEARKECFAVSASGVNGVAAPLSPPVCYRTRRSACGGCASASGGGAGGAAVLLLGLLGALRRRESASSGRWG